MMSGQIQMQAKSSSNGRLYTWTASAADWAGAGWASSGGPGSPLDIAMCSQPAGQPGTPGGAGFHVTTAYVTNVSLAACPAANDGITVGVTSPLTKVLLTSQTTSSQNGIKFVSVDNGDGTVQLVDTGELAALGTDAIGQIISVLAGNRSGMLFTIGTPTNFVTTSAGFVVSPAGTENELGPDQPGVTKGKFPARCPVTPASIANGATSVIFTLDAVAELWGSTSVHALVADILILTGARAATLAHRVGTFKGAAALALFGQNPQANVDDSGGAGAGVTLSWSVTSTTKASLSCTNNTGAAITVAGVINGMQFTP